MKIAGAPISWGVCEVPGWGYQLAPDRVLAEMRDVGLSATELGPEGFLPSDPDELTALLDSYGLSCVGAFVPVLLHDDDHDPLPDIAGPLDALVACGRRGSRARRGDRHRRLRLPPDTRRRPVGHAAGQPGPAGRGGRRARRARGAASARRHDGGDPRATSTACWTARHPACASTPATC